MQNKIKEPIEFVEKRKAYKDGYYLYMPQWNSYDTVPKRISPFLFGILSLSPFYITNPFNGYLVRKNKWFSEKYLGDFIYNPNEKTDLLLKQKYEL